MRLLLQLYSQDPRYRESKKRLRAPDGEEAAAPTQGGKAPMPMPPRLVPARNGGQDGSDSDQMLNIHGRPGKGKGTHPGSGQTAKVQKQETRKQRGGCDW